MKIIQDGTEKMKLIAVVNTIDVLTALGMGNKINSPITSVNLSSVLEQADFSKVTGFSKYSFQKEIEELKKIEELK